MATSALSQTKKVSDNKKPEFSKNYYQKENPQDTTYVVLDFKREGLEIRKGEEKAGDYKFGKMMITMHYNPPVSPNEIVYFSHYAGPPFGHEVYSINKKSIPKDKIVLESDKTSTYWYQNYVRSIDRFVILIDLNDWKSEEEWIKGVDVMVRTNTIE